MTKKKWIIVATTLVTVIAGVFIYLGQTNSELVSKDLLPTVGSATEMHMSDKAQEAADADYFTLQINPTATFENGSSNGSIEIVNPGSNVYPIAVDISLVETGELVYQSGAIEPNHQITSGKLMTPLDKGSYKARANVSIYDPKTKERQGLTQADITINVLN